MYFLYTISLHTKQRSSNVKHFFIILLMLLFFISCQKNLMLSERAGTYFEKNAIENGAVKDDVVIVRIDENGYVVVDGNFNEHSWVDAMFTNTITNSVLTIKDFCIIDFKSEKTLEVSNFITSKKVVCEKIEGI